MTGAPDALVVPRAVLDEVLDHARAGLPAEACGVLAGRGGVATRFLPAINPAASPTFFEISGDELLRITLDVEGADEDIVAIYHSHVQSPAVPSRTDVEILGRWWPHVAWLIVSLGTDPPQARVFGAGEGRPFAPRELVVG